MGTSLSRLNNKLSFDFDTYIQERDELARDLRGLATDAAWHRRVKGSWQVFQGASGVAAGLAGGLALATTPITFGLSLPVVATTAAMVGSSISAASMASSAASYGYEHVVDKDIAKRLMNMRHVIFSIALKDKEICVFIAKKYSDAATEQNRKESAPGTHGVKVSKAPFADTKNSLSPHSDSRSKANSVSTKRNSPTVDSARHGDDSSTVATSIIGTPTHPKQLPKPIRACQNLCEVWDSWDLASKENKKVGFDLALALVRSSGLVLGANSIVQGSKTVQEAHDDLETALLQTAEALEKETGEIRLLDLRYCSCIPYERKLPRGRLQHVDGGGGQVDMLVSFDHYYGVRETLQSDSTNTIRLPEYATNVKVTFRDRAGKTVKKVDRAAAKQEWVKDASGKHELEECSFDVADGADVIFVVKGALTHAFIHKAWDFGRTRGKPRQWEWWENAAEECKTLIPGIEQRLANRSASNGKRTLHSAALCCQAA